MSCPKLLENCKWTFTTIFTLLGLIIVGIGWSSTQSAQCYEKTSQVEVKVEKERSTIEAIHEDVLLIKKHLLGDKNE
jgi:hypothetical protein